METLITLIIFAAVAVFSAVLKRKQEEPWDGPAPPPAPRGEQPPVLEEPRRISWEEEMRRLLQGEPAPPPPPPITAPPPMPRSQHPPPRGGARPTFTPPAVPVRPIITEVKEVVAQQLPDLLNRASQAYERARQMDLAAAEQLRKIAELHPSHQAARRRGISPTAAAAIALVRNPQTVRSAVIASVILGPPRALES